MIMKRLIAVLLPVLMIVGGAHATGGVPPKPKPPGDTIVKVNNNIDTTQVQKVSVVSVSEGGDAASFAQGGSADSDSVAASNASVNTTSVSNYKTRTPPITVFPPSLPYWNHGGWGTIKAYFSNGPNNDNNVYERTFDPENPSDTQELRGVLEAIPYDGPLDVLGGVLNGVGAVFGGPDNYHHGRGFEIANSLVRNRRPGGTPLLVFIDSNVNTRLLKEAGYAYVGKVSLEGKVSRNWDQVYDAAVAETLPWDVDILLISGGMKGVTVGSNLAFPGAGGAYSQANYSLSMFGSVSSGITEGKGKAMVSAEGYRFRPEVINRRRIPQSFYDRIHASVVSKPPGPVQETVAVAPSYPSTARRRDPRSAAIGQRILAAERAKAARRAEAEQRERKKNVHGFEISRQLWEMAEFDENEMVDYVILR